jgi:TolB-like protein/tetratricopeptide (TPR) repeat protein
MELSPDLILSEVDKIASSAAFRLAARQRSFLRHIVQETLEGRSGFLKEYSIGIAVFGRDPSFDPRHSSIVRTEARKLRARLAKYYGIEGKEDPVRIELPLGTYAPILTQSPVLPVAPSTSAGRARQGESRPLRILVLPFENRGVSKRDEEFSDGLTDELSHALARTPNIEVVARASAFQFKGRPVDVRELAQRFNVHAVIEGSVRRSGDRVRILVQMDDTSSERTAWSQTYGRKVGGAFRVQEEIARTIVERLTSRSHMHQPAAALEGQSARLAGDPRAYHEYLQGLYSWNRHTMEGFAAAVGFFRRAIDRDVRFARAYTNLAYAYLMLPVVKAALPSRFLPEVRAAASKALEIDPLAGEAHIALALPLVQDFQWCEAGQRFRKGLDLAPSDAFGHAWYGMYLATMGRPTDALKEQELAVQLDPASPVTACCHGQTLYLLRSHDDAGRCFRRALALAPSLPRAHAGLGLSLLQQGYHAQAIAELEQALALTPGLGRVKADLGYAYALSGNREKAREILNEFLKLFRPSAFPALMIAEIYIGLGENDMAFQWLNKAFDQKDLAPFLTCDPLFDPLRPDPRFSGLLKRANLL